MFTNAKDQESAEDCTLSDILLLFISIAIIFLDSNSCMHINMFYFRFFPILFLSLCFICVHLEPCVADFADRHLFGLASILFPFDVFDLIALRRIRGRPDGVRFFFRTFPFLFRTEMRLRKRGLKQNSNFSHMECGMVGSRRSRCTNHGGDRVRYGRTARRSAAGG